MMPSQESKKSSTSSTPRQLLFVEGIVGDKKRSKQSRAHVARVNRARQRDEKLRLIDSQGSTNGTLPSAAFTTPSELGDVAQQRSSSVVVRRLDYDNDPKIRDSRYHSAPTVPQLSRPVSPIFGALDVNSFKLEHSVEAADTANYIFNHVMDSWLDPNHKPTWVAAFFQHSLVFHCLSYSCGILQDVACGRAIQQRRLVHRLKTIQIVNQQLSHLDTVDPEPILLAITTLWRINMDQLDEQREVPLLFTPHRRGASWVAVAGKLGGDDSHSRAMVELVSRVGGLNNFHTLPSLQETLALGDVLHSSASATKPNFPSIWNVRVLLDTLGPMLLPLSADVEGRGFADIMLPAGALTSLQRVSKIDKLLDNASSQTISLPGEITIANLGNAVQHELLSLVPWLKLTSTEQEGCHLPLYEFSRIAATLYSNAVIFPMSPKAAWLEKLLEQLRLLLETSNVGIWDDSVIPLLVWTLVIGTMAAFWTPHRTFFLDQLRSTLKVAGLSSWPEVKQILQRFLWRDSSCEQGATIIWNYLEPSEGPNRTASRRDKN